ncbi:MAG: solute-binding protein [Deltaproteobacteria bacterium]|nr:solute-binding protein [Deltaproteobacteria bacterium]
MRIGIVDPELGPAGRYARRVLEKYARLEPHRAAVLEKNIVSYESHVRALLDKVLRRELDAGFVYRSDILKVADRVGNIRIPSACSVTPEYAMARLREAAVPRVAGAFMVWLLNPENEKIWRDYGFEPLEKAAAQLPPALASGIGETADRATGPLRVFAAAVFYDVLPVLARRFSKSTGIEVECEFAGSGKLYHKILQGAVGECGADLFLSAAPRYVEELRTRGRADLTLVFMGNELIVVVGRGSGRAPDKNG